jgi:hypothetical protein
MGFLRGWKMAVTGCPKNMMRRSGNQFDNRAGNSFQVSPYYNRITGIFD